MHVRLTTCRGASVVDRAGELLGTLSGVFLHPDTGKVEGIFVAVPAGLTGTEHPFCAFEDIIHWGAVVQISGRDAFAPLEDRIRLAPVIASGRTVVGQPIRTESGRLLGTCRDVQFDTEKMRVEWLFPRRFFRPGVALPISDVVEIRKDAIIVRDGMKAEAEPAVEKEPVSYEAFPEIVPPTATRIRK
ncbi:hypothetical protein A2881_00855 [Candidatus Peribacteria bacterium RIFCSPHIGHO2_01_FULL_55_13]|nr:MAG: hypothetical protein A2881_00855 [Candidatus Peribacteria bacterium RIFCSPHIGHO2_01_FULL_55_13]